MKEWYETDTARIQLISPTHHVYPWMGSSLSLEMLISVHWWQRKLSNQKVSDGWRVLDSASISVQVSILSLTHTHHNWIQDFCPYFKNSFHKGSLSLSLCHSMYVYWKLKKNTRCSQLMQENIQGYVRNCQRKNSLDTKVSYLMHEVNSNGKKRGKNQKTLFLACLQLWGSTSLNVSFFWFYFSFH